MKPLILIALLCTAASAQVPDRLCLKDSRVNLEVNTVARSFTISIDGETFSGPFIVNSWEPAFFYIAGAGQISSATFYTNLSFLRHSSFVTINRVGGGFTAWNADHLDCDGNATTAPPWSVKIVGNTRGVAPFQPELRAVPLDFEPLSNFAWCLDEKMVAFGPSFAPRFDQPGKYVVEVEAFYNDIEASAEVEIIVDPPDQLPPPQPPPINHPPTLTVAMSGKLKKNKPLTFTADATDPDNDALQFTWLCSDGFASTARSFERRLKRGQYECSCTANDSHGGEVTECLAFSIR